MIDDDVVPAGDYYLVASLDSSGTTILIFSDSWSDIGDGLTSTGSASPTTTLFGIDLASITAIICFVGYIDRRRKMLI